MATNNFALITKYSQKALDQILIEKSATAILEGEQKFVKFDFTNAKKVKIGTLRTSGMGNYARAGSAGIQGNGTGFDGTGHNDGYPVGGGELVWNEYELGFDRAIQLRIDAMDDEEAAGLIIANVYDTFTREHVISEIDECRFARIAEKAYTSLGNRVSKQSIPPKVMPTRSHILGTLPLLGSRNTEYPKMNRSSSSLPMSILPY